MIDLHVIVAHVCLLPKYIAECMGDAVVPHLRLL